MQDGQSGLCKTSVSPQRGYPRTNCVVDVVGNKLNELFQLSSVQLYILPCWFMHLPGKWHGHFSLYEWSECGFFCDLKLASHLTYWYQLKLKCYFSWITGSWFWRYIRLLLSSLERCYRQAELLDSKRYTWAVKSRASSCSRMWHNTKFIHVCWIFDKSGVFMAHFYQRWLHFAQLFQSSYLYNTAGVPSFEASHKVLFVSDNGRSWIQNLRLYVVQKSINLEFPNLIYLHGSLVLH